MKFVTLLCFVLISFCLQAQRQAEIYINKFDSLAIEVMNVYGIPASVTLGIALQESGAGTSKLCRINHNHFGVKGQAKSSKTPSGQASAYRSFVSDEAAYLYFGKMVAKKKYYPALMGTMDYMKWLKAMKAAKYATAHNWVEHVDKMIKRHDLTRFDKIIPIPLLPASSANDSIKILE